MFNLDKSVENWLKNLQRHSILKQYEIDELHDHLTCLIDTNLENGMDREEAFTAAVNRMGRGRDILNEYFKISFTDRLRRLPKPLVAIATGFALAGALGLPDMFRTWVGILTSDKGNLEINLFGLLLVPVLFIHLGFKLIYLRDKAYSAAVNCIRLLLVAFSGLAILQILLFSKFKNITRENTNLTIDGPASDFLYAHPTLIIAIALTASFFMIVLLFLAQRALTKDAIKCLFSVEDSKNTRKHGLIQQPLKTFKWLPY